MATSRSLLITEIPAQLNLTKVIETKWKEIIIFALIIAATVEYRHAGTLLRCLKAPAFVLDAASADAEQAAS